MSSDAGVPTKKRKISCDVDETIEKRMGIISLLNESDHIFLRELLVHAFSLPFKQHRDNFYDRLALVDCALEIINSRVDKCKCAIAMCHRIQNTLSNDEIRSGWRVQFSPKGSSHRFFYLNDLLSQRRSISFRNVLR